MSVEFTSCFHLWVKCKLVHGCCLLVDDTCQTCAGSCMGAADYAWQDSVVNVVSAFVGM